MANIIYLKIDCSKIDKARLFAGKNGAQYLDCVCIPSSNSQYGDSHMIVQSVTKEERLAGKKGPILGNAKEQEPRDNQDRNSPPPRQAPAPRQPAPSPDDDGDVPF